MFFKKDKTIVAVANGKSVDITTVNDDAFSSKMLGDGIGIIPSDGKVVSPIEGIITMIFPTKHAFSVKSKEGVELLIHIGIDTVSLEGQGFTSRATDGQKVKKGDTIIEVDLDLLQNKNIDTTIMVIITETTGKVFKMNVGENTVAGETVVINA